MVSTFSQETQGDGHPCPDLSRGAEAGQGGRGAEAVTEPGQEAAASVDAVLDEAETSLFPGSSQDRGQSQRGHNQEHLNMGSLDNGH